MKDKKFIGTTDKVSYFTQILDNTNLSSTDDIIRDIRELLKFNTRLDIDIITTNVNNVGRICISYDYIEPILNMETKRVVSSGLSSINIFFSTFPSFDTQELNYVSVQMGDGIFYLDGEHISIDTIDEFSTELYLNKLITDLDVHVDINTFKRILKLCYDVLMNRIPISFIDFTDDKIFQGNLIDFLEYVI